MNILVDGSSLLWRTHYANKSKNREGVNADIHLFLKSLKSYASMYNSRNIYIAWDKKAGNGLNFRQTQSNGVYKNQRDGEQAKEVYECQPQLHNITEKLGCKNFYPWIMEADDVIAWLSKTLDGQNIIVTTDRDMLQLISEKTCVYNPHKKTIIDHKNFSSIMEMPIEHYLPYKAILGDSSDNIKGLHGYGPVGSKKLAKKWVDKEEIDPEKIEVIKQNIQLMDLNIGYKLAGERELQFYQEQLDKNTKITPDFETFELLCNKYEFNSITKEIDNWKNTFDIPHLLKILSDMGY